VVNNICWQAKGDESGRAAKEKAAWCATGCAAACKMAQNSRTNLLATNDLVRNSVGSGAAADIPDFVAVDLCGGFSAGATRQPTNAG